MKYKNQDGFESEKGRSLDLPGNKTSYNAAVIKAG